MRREDIEKRVAEIERSARENPPHIPELQDLAEIRGKLDLILDILKKEVVKE